MKRITRPARGAKRTVIGRTALLLAAYILLGFLPVGIAERLPDVIISQVMTGNPSLCLSVEDVYYDWLELKNTTEDTVSLKDWILSDHADLRNACRFGDVSLPAGGTCIVYCARRPSGHAGPEIFSGFGLSANGETLLLLDPAERQPFVLEVPAMEAGEIYTCDGKTGAYLVIPYAESDLAEANRVDLEPPFDPDALYISEMMPSNGSTLADGDGEYPDWIELYNGGAEPVCLEGWSISDDDANWRKWIFPNVTAAPGEYLVIFASGKNRSPEDGELHTNFRLKASGETVRLYRPDGSVQSWMTCGSMRRDGSVTRRPDGRTTQRETPSPGAEKAVVTTEEGTELEVSRALTRNGMDLYISEILSSGTGSDWLEIQNAGAAEADLSGMGLSDDPLRPRKWLFPQGTLLAPGGYLQITLAGKNGSITGPLCADLALSDGETAVLALPDGTVLDSVAVRDQWRGISYGRADGYSEYRYFSQPTPGKPNTTASYAGRAAKVVYSAEGGLQEGSGLTLSLSAEPGMDIYYTLDGSQPTPSSAVYTSPLVLEGNTVVKAVAWGDDYIPSLTEGKTYLFGVPHTLRLVCVSGDRSKLNGSGGMLNTGSKGTGCEVFVEIYEPDGTQLIAQNCWFLLAGHGSRMEIAQKGFSLRARKQYGDNLFRAPLFSRRDYTEYKSIFMRASGQDAEKTHMQDSVLTSLAEDTDLLYQETECTVLYVNGEYWGEYNLRERISVECICQFENWDDPDDVVLLEGGVGSMMAVQGSANAYKALIAQVKKSDLTKDSAVEELRKYVDIENYLDYVAFQIYTANQDLNNVRIYSIPAAGIPWRWVLYDLDLGYLLDSNSVSRWLKSGGVGTITTQDNTLFIALMKNAKIRDYFLTRMGRLLATTFSPENVVSRFMARAELIYPEMERTCVRWGWSIKTWQKKGAAAVQYARTRPVKLIGYFKSAMDLSDAEVQKYFGEALAAAQSAGQ